MMLCNLCRVRACSHSLPELSFSDLRYFPPQLSALVEALLYFIVQYFRR
jgi:hypothetical protein